MANINQPYLLFFFFFLHKWKEEKYKKKYKIINIVNDLMRNKEKKIERKTR